MHIARPSLVMGEKVSFSKHCNFNMVIASDSGKQTKPDSYDALVLSSLNRVFQLQ